MVCGSGWVGDVVGLGRVVVCGVGVRCGGVGG